MRYNNENTIFDISVIVPIYNEEKIIPELYLRIKNTLKTISDNHEIIFVNDGSKDNSIHEIFKLAKNDNNVFFIDFSRNFGHQIAVTAGLDKCRGDLVVIIDGDLQDPPELIKEMYEKQQEGYDIVYAKRKYRKGESWFKKVTAKYFYILIKNITSIDMPVNVGDYRIITRRVVEYLKLMPEQNKFIRGQIAWLGFKQTEVLFNRDERKYGKTGYSFSKMLSFAIDGIVAFSDLPLKLVTRLGFFIWFFSLLIIIYALFSNFILKSTISGWTSQIISFTFIGGIQLFSIGIIGEYINRINNNVRKRPLYIIKDINIKHPTTKNIVHSEDSTKYENDSN